MLARFCALLLGALSAIAQETVMSQDGLTIYQCPTSMPNELAYRDAVYASSEIGTPLQFFSVAYQYNPNRSVGSIFLRAIYGGDGIRTACNYFSGGLYRPFEEVQNDDACPPIDSGSLPTGGLQRRHEVIPWMKRDHVFDDPLFMCPTFIGGSEARYDREIGDRELGSPLLGCIFSNGQCYYSNDGLLKPDIYSSCPERLCEAIYTTRRPNEDSAITRRQVDTARLRRSRLTAKPVPS